MHQPIEYGVWLAPGQPASAYTSVPLSKMHKASTVCKKTLSSSGNTISVPDRRPPRFSLIALKLSSES
eukprot:6489483-Amphidinium_carterae.1